MDSNNTHQVKADAKHWYISLLVGILFLLMGFWVFTRPVASYLALAALFAILFLVAGFLEILYSLSNRQMKNWGWQLAGGILQFIIGIVLYLSPGLTMAILPIYVGFVFLFRSSNAIGLAIDFKRDGDLNWGWLLLFGVLGLILSLMLLFNPVFASFSIVTYTAIVLFVSGVGQIILALRLKKLKKTLS